MDSQFVRGYWRYGTNRAYGAYGFYRQYWTNGAYGSDRNNRRHWPNRSNRTNRGGIDSSRTDGANRPCRIGWRCLHAN